MDPENDPMSEVVEIEKFIKPKRERETWGDVEFLMNCISSSVGLGNVWRFSFVVYDNGGSAFVIAYICIVFLVGMPMLFLGMFLGQFSGRSSVKVWEILPFFRGIGIAQVSVLFCSITSVAAIVSLTIYYLFASFTLMLPWETCGLNWGADCVDARTNLIQINITGGVSSTEYFFEKVVLKSTSNIDNGIGLPDLELSIWLLFTWIITILILWRGIRSYGKIAYFLALFPYVILIGFLIHSLLQNGSMDGLHTLLKPDFNELKNAQMWYSATIQVFYSLSCMGGMITHASYNNFRTDIFRIAVTICILDTITSFICGITVFATLGNLALILGVDIKHVVKSGPALAFISYPEAIAKINYLPQLFSAIFFLMLFIISIGSLLGSTNAITTTIRDYFPFMKYRHINIVICLVAYLIGLIYVTPGGQWMITFVDHYLVTFPSFVLALIYLCSIVWIYSTKNVCRDIEFMLSRRVNIYLRTCWFLVTPIFLFLIFIYYLATTTTIKFGPFEFPSIVHVIGWILFGIIAIQFPLWAILSIEWKSPIIKNVKKTFRPAKKWGPRNSKHREEWLEFCAAKKNQIENLADRSEHGPLQKKFNKLIGNYG